MKTKKITVKDGITINNYIYGTGEHNIILLHDLSGAYPLHPELIEAIEQSNVTLIIPEKVGYGQSSNVALKSMLDWVDIYKELVAKLSIVSADAIGCSAGGAQTYAIAYALPNIIKKLHLVAATPASYDEEIMKHLSPEYQKMYEDYRNLSIKEIQELLVEFLAHSRDKYKDDAIMQEGFDRLLANDCYGMAVDCKIQALPWDIPFEAIQQPIHFYHSKNDEMIPYAAVKAMSKKFNNVTFTTIDVEGENIHTQTIMNVFFDIFKGYER